MSREDVEKWDEGEFPKSFDRKSPGNTHVINLCDEEAVQRALDALENEIGSGSGRAFDGLCREMAESDLHPKPSVDTQAEANSLMNMLKLKWVSPYDVNPYHNFKSILGQNVVNWFNPFVEPELKGEGMAFEIRDDIVTATEINKLTEPFKPQPPKMITDTLGDTAEQRLEDQPETGDRSVSHNHPSAALTEAALSQHANNGQRAFNLNNQQAQVSAMQQPDVEQDEDISESAVDEAYPPEQVPTSRPGSVKGGNTGSQQSSKQSSLMMAQNGAPSVSDGDNLSMRDSHRMQVVGNPLASTPGPHGQSGASGSKSPSCRVLGEGSEIAGSATDRMSGMGGIAQDEQQQVLVGMTQASASSSSAQIVNSAQQGLGGLGLDAQGNEVALNFQDPTGQLVDKEKICFGERLNIEDVEQSPVEGGEKKVDKSHLRVRVEPGQAMSEVLDDATRIMNDGSAYASAMLARFGMMMGQKEIASKGVM